LSLTRHHVFHIFIERVRDFLLLSFPLVLPAILPSLINQFRSLFIADPSDLFALAYGFQSLSKMQKYNRSDPALVGCQTRLNSSDALTPTLPTGA
jgi:hypothetical protein